MKFGATIFPTDYSIGIVELARELEQRGFESLFVPEHTHIPASRLTPYPGGTDLPTEYSHTLDPFVALSAAAAVTTNLKLGTGISLVIEHDPIVLAKQVASIDYLSGGRFIFGIGGGWNREEMENHGTSYPRRWRLLRERMLAMKQIWTEDEATYHGEFVNFDRIWSWPKPAQKPHPPVLVGGSGAHTFDRVIEYGDEWMPIFGRGGAPIGGLIADLQRRAADAGRGPIPVSIFGPRTDPQTIEDLERAGVSRCVFWMPPAGADKVLSYLDRVQHTISALA